MNVEITDKFGLEKNELEFLKVQAQTLGFESVSYADEMQVFVTKHTPCKGERWTPEMDVLFEWSSSDDRGNGYFGYSSTHKLLQEDMEEYFNE